MFKGVGYAALPALLLWAAAILTVAHYKKGLGALMAAIADFLSTYAGWMPTTVLALILALCTVAAFIWAIAANVDGRKR